MPTPNKYNRQNRMEIYNIQGKVRKTEKTVVLEINTGGTILEMHFGDPAQLMNFFVLMIEEMAKVFPDFEASKLWLDDSFK
jgi:hypothetical protein